LGSEKIKMKQKKSGYFGLVLVGLLLILLQACGSSDESENQAWEPIFNGKDLSDWAPKFTGQPYGVNFKNTFRAKDGKLVADYSTYDRFDNNFGHLFYEEKLSHFKLRLEYRFVGEQVPGGPEWAFKNSGIKFHAPHPSTLPLDQELLVAIEAQIIGGDGVSSRTTGNVCTAGTHIEMNEQLITQHCTGTSFSAFSDDRWVKMEIEVHGSDSVIHRVNNEVVLAYEHPQLDTTDTFSRTLYAQGQPLLLSEGYIALQAESSPIEFRNIELMRLKP